MNTTTLLSHALPHTTDTYWGHLDEISKYNVHLNFFERLWLAWYAYIGNDVLATGIMSFMMHELIYFGRSLPWIIIDCIPAFNKYKIQNVCDIDSVRSFKCFVLTPFSQQKIPTAAEQWNCAKLVLLSHFTVELPQIW